MRRVSVLLIIFLTSAIGAADWAKLSREDRCKSSGGEIAGHGTAQMEAPKKDGANFSGPIDCTCGGKRFNALHEGDVCRDGKALSAIEHYCQDSKGTIVKEAPDAKTSEALKPKGGTSKWPMKVFKCTCGGVAFVPTAKSSCNDGKVTN